MAEIKRLMDRVKKLNKGDRLLAMVFIGDDSDIKVNYFIDGVTSKNGTEYCSDEDDVNKFIFDLMEKYHIFSENCCIYEFVNDLDE